MLNKDYKPKVGDKLWLYPKDKRNNDAEGLIEVSKVGKKYFYVKRPYMELRFDLKTFIQDGGQYSPSYEIFHSKQTCEYYFETFRTRRCLTDRLFRFLTDEEVNSLYNELILRDK